MRITAVILSMLMLANLVFCPMALAGDTDPAGTKLKGIVDEYLANAPENDAKANKLREAGGSSATSNGQNGSIYPFLCAAEVMTVIGLVIWENRRDSDDCGRDLPGMSGYQYCMGYSNHCDHWVWDSSCLKGQGCKPSY